MCDRPISCCAARLEMKLPLAPLCVTTAIEPARDGARKPPVHSGTLSMKLTKPRQFGPSSDTPCCRASDASRAWWSAPAWPVSAKPDVRITALCTSAVARSASASSIATIGTMSSARSIGAPTAAHEVAALRPCTVPPRRLTRWMSPGYLRFTRLSNVFCDQRDRSVAPTSAIERGRSIAVRFRREDMTLPSVRQIAQQRHRIGSEAGNLLVPLFIRSEQVQHDMPHTRRMEFANALRHLLRPSECAV